jgi:hypothetical protein
MVELKFELARNGRDLKRGIRKGSALVGPFRCGNSCHALPLLSGAGKTRFYCATVFV